MNIRIQTYSEPPMPHHAPRATNPRSPGGPAVAALSKGLQDIQDMCDVVSEEFTRSLSEFKVDRMET